MLSDDQRRLLLDWTRKIHTLEYAHRYQSMGKERLNLVLGVLVVVGSAGVGTQGFSQAADYAPTILGTVTAILAALLTFLKPSEAAEKHRSASCTYEEIRHELELVMTFGFSGPDSQALVERVKAKWEALDTPNVSNRSWGRAKYRVSEVGTYPEALELEEFRPTQDRPSH